MKKVISIVLGATAIIALSASPAMAGKTGYLGDGRVGHTGPTTSVDIYGK